MPFAHTDRAAFANNIAAIAHDAEPSAAAHIVVHYHELWLKRGNRAFFLHKLRYAIRRALNGLAITRMSQPSDRLVIDLANATQRDEALQRLARVSGIAHFAVARIVERRGDPAADPLEPIRAAAWDEVRGERFSTFAVRARRSDKRFPVPAMTIEREVGGYLFDKLEAEGRGVRVDLKNPELTCRIEIARGPVLVYARRIAGPGGLPADTAGKLVCLLSGGFDSAVAAFKMIKRGAHLIFVHFWQGGGPAGESSVHVARALLERLVPWQFTAKLYLVPFEPLQREIAAGAPEEFRTLLYRRLMLRIAERIALREKAKGLITGDSLGQVASQTLQNMLAVGSIARLPLYRMRRKIICGKRHSSSAACGQLRSRDSATCKEKSSTDSLLVCIAERGVSEEIPEQPRRTATVRNFFQRNKAPSARRRRQIGN